MRRTVYFYRPVKIIIYNNDKENIAILKTDAIKALNLYSIYMSESRATTLITNKILELFNKGFKLTIDIEFSEDSEEFED